MPIKIRGVGLAPVLVYVFMIFTPVIHADSASIPHDQDLEAPRIEHEIIGREIYFGDSLEINAVVKDNMGVKSVTLSYRNVGAKEYLRVTLDKKADTDRYTTVLGNDVLSIPGIEYYLQAVDFAGNSLTKGYEFSPYFVVVKNSKEVEVNFPIASPRPPDDTDTLWWVLGISALVAIAAVSDDSSDNDGQAAKPENDATTVTVGVPVPFDSQ